MHHSAARRALYPSVSQPFDSVFAQPNRLIIIGLSDGPHLHTSQLNLNHFCHGAIPIVDPGDGEFCPAGFQLSPQRLELGVVALISVVLALQKR